MNFMFLIAINAYIHNGIAVSPTPAGGGCWILSAGYGGIHRGEAGKTA